jgi:hypothetical protein
MFDIESKLVLRLFGLRKLGEPASALEFFFFLIHILGETMIMIDFLVTS